MPTVTVRMIEADPITIPSMVSRNRALPDLKLSTASDTISLHIIVERALASVVSKVLASGLDMLVVAIGSGIRRLPVSQRFEKRSTYNSGCSHCPDSAERKIACITAMFAIAFSSGTGTGPSSRIALENAWHCSAY